MADEELKVSIAAQACLPLLGLDIDWYDDWSTIILTPREYDVRQKDVDEAGVVHEYDDEFAGEAFSSAPSRSPAPTSRPPDGATATMSSFTRWRTSSTGGAAPSTAVRPCAGRWITEPGASLFLRPSRTFAARSRGLPTRRLVAAQGRPRIDSYAAESPEEFFAVACEYFYEKPHLLRSEYPQVFAQLFLFFGRDPTGAR